MRELMLDSRTLPVDFQCPSLHAVSRLWAENAGSGRIALKRVFGVTSQPGADRDKIFPMRTAAEDREATKLMREYDRIVQRLAELGLDIVKLRAVDKR